MEQEIELKLSLPSALLPELKAHPILQRAEKLGGPKVLDNTYFDTLDFHLQKDLIALRTRQQGDEWVQTVKCAAVSLGGLSQRPEWERPYTGEFNFDNVENKSLRKKLQMHQPQLRPVFTTLFSRESFYLKTDDGAELLLMLDQGEVLAKGKRLSLCELELELVSGSAQDLFQLAIELAKTLPLVPSDISKAERGYRLFCDNEEQPVKMLPVALSKREVALDAFKRLSFACVAQWQANVPGVMASNDTGYVHQLRISQRRIQALLYFFSPILNKEWVAHWKGVLGENARIFSDVRDFDVVCDDILPSVFLQPGANDWPLASLQQLVSSQRVQSRVKLMEQPALMQQGLLILTLVSELHLLEHQHSEGLPLAIFVQERLNKLLKKSKKAYKKALKSGDFTSLHLLRERLKPLRYALEFFMAVIPSKQTMKTYQSVMMAIRALGQINDHYVSKRILSGLAANDPQHQLALAFLSGLQSKTLADQQKTALRSLSCLF